MKSEISIVLFHPDFALLRETLEGVLANRDACSCVRILHSCCTPLEDRRLDAMFEDIGFDLPLHVLHRLDNLGFSAGHNELLRQAFMGGSSHVVVLNPDVVMHNGALNCLMYSTIGLSHALVGPITRLRFRQGGGSATVIDSAGIGWTPTGRHIDRRQGEGSVPVVGAIDRVSGVSGAALLMSAEVYHRLANACGEIFDEFFLAYREDAELGIRAAKLGIDSYVVDIPGFVHARNVVGSDRSRGALINYLGVRNRFLIRFKLGASRPGTRVLIALRDVIVVCAVLTVERTSLPGLLEALRVRRALRYSGRSVEFARLELDQ